MKTTIWQLDQAPPSGHKPVLEGNLIVWKKCKSMEVRAWTFVAFLIGYVLAVLALVRVTDPSVQLFGLAVLSFWTFVLATFSICFK